MSEPTPPEPTPAEPAPAGESLFEPLFGNPSVAARTGGRAWVRALLDVEAALARAGARAGLVPAEAATAIAACCAEARFAPGQLGRRGADAASVVVPLVRDLTALVPASARPYVHLGATSQDLMDTAMCLVAYRAGEVILADLAGCAERLADLAGTYRDTPQVGRTLLQQALPTTFGAVCAGWLVGVREAAAGFARVRDHRLAVQYGGAVGTLAALGTSGPVLATLLAEELGLPAPVVPWHTSRGRVAELAAALGVVAGALATVALDITLLAQTEVGEVAEGGGGGSSTMPHKRNPARAVLVLAATHRVPGLVGTVLAAMPQELQRATGRWQAEAPTVTELLRLVGGAAGHARALLAGLRVHPERMRVNMALTGGAVLAESVAVQLAGALGRDRAHDLVATAVRRAHDEGVPLRAVLATDPRVGAVLTGAELDHALDPTRYLGAAGQFVDAALDGGPG